MTKEGNGGDTPSASTKPLVKDHLPPGRGRREDRSRGIGVGEQESGNRDRGKGSEEAKVTGRQWLGRRHVNEEYKLKKFCKFFKSFKIGIFF